MDKFRALRLTLLALVLGGCGQGEWQLETWGEDYIEDEIPQAAFDDGCQVRFSGFWIVLSEGVVLDGDGRSLGGFEGGVVFDVAQPGPHDIGAWSVPSGYYDSTRFVIAPGEAPEAGNVSQEEADVMADEGASVRVQGTLTCGGEAADFDWSFSGATTYTCEPESLTLPRNGVARTQFTIHGDHLFYDSLEDADAGLKGLPILGADSNGDGAVTLAELDAVSVATLGHSVGRYSDVTTLGAFIAHLSQTLGHIDGEGHCDVDL